MTDYIIGVADPRQWHSEINDIANDIGVGVHFNPFVSCNKKVLSQRSSAETNTSMLSSWVVTAELMCFLILSLLWIENIEMFQQRQKTLLALVDGGQSYLVPAAGGRWKVNILVDKLDIKNVNTVNLKAATSAALLLLPSKFTEEDLYAKICSLSYMGDLRMLFAEDKNKVKKIVRGQFYLFEEMYKPFLEEYEANNLLRFSSAGDKQVNIFQDCGLSAASTLVSSLPSSIRSDMAMKLGDKRIVDDSGRVRQQVVIGSKEQAAECMKRVVRRRVMFSSTRQAAAGLLTAGAVHGVRYVANKMCKAWKSRV
ncbi:putative haloacid dehalogenase-like hydrolase domain-containing protein 3-like [Capsicum annuum]|nr:putative haloacid dehalogenase-like hydrolase domain-containing protein 3-like [Capsicum annuum]